MANSTSILYIDCGLFVGEKKCFVGGYIIIIITLSIASTDYWNNFMLLGIYLQFSDRNMIHLSM